MIIRMVFAVAASMLTVAGLSAQPAMQWKFAVGNVYECERIATQKQTVELKGKTFPSNRQSTWLVRLEVLAKNADAARVQATLAKVEHRLTPAVADEMLDPKLNEKMRGSAFQLDVTPTGRLTKLDGYEDFLKRLAKDDKGKLKALRATFPEETLRQAFADLFGPLPEKTVAKGNTWQRDYIELIPHFGSLRSEVNSVYAGVKDSYDQVTYLIQTKYELPKDDKSVLFRVTKGSIASENAAGMILFDSRAGFLSQHERRMLLRGTLTIEVMDRPQPMEFSSDNEVKIRIKSIKR